MVLVHRLKLSGHSLQGYIKVKTRFGTNLQVQSFCKFFLLVFSVGLYLYCISIVLYCMSASPSLLFYHAFLLFMSLYFCVYFMYFIGCHFGIINDDGD